MPSRRQFLRQAGGTLLGTPLFHGAQDDVSADYEINIYQSTRLTNETVANKFEAAEVARRWLRSVMLACDADADISVVREPIDVQGEDDVDLLDSWEQHLKTRSDTARDSNVLMERTSPTSVLGRAFVGGEAAVAFSGPQIVGQQHPVLWERRTTDAIAVVHEVLHNLGFRHSDGTAYELETGGFGISGDSEDYPLYLSSVMLATYALKDVDSGETNESPELESYSRLWVSPLPRPRVANTLSRGEYGDLLFGEKTNCHGGPKQENGLLTPDAGNAPRDQNVDGVYETVGGCELTPFELVNLIRTVETGPAQTPIGRRGLDVTADGEVTYDDILGYLDDRY